jgi:release factor glutamine methyltransferase
MTVSPQSPPTLLCSFGPLAVEYDERVLVPRLWTFLQSSWAADLASTSAPGPILELYAGAGHIGLAAAVLADRDLVQVEADPVAARYARRNAARAGRADRVDVRLASITDALAAAETFPLVVADPPYLPSARVADWPADPVSAIDGGADGLDHIRCCLDVVEQHLAADGYLVLQIAGPAQADQVRAHLAARGPGALRIVEQREVDDARAVVLLAR